MCQSLSTYCLCNDNRFLAKSPSNKLFQQSIMPQVNFTNNSSESKFWIFFHTLSFQNWFHEKNFKVVKDSLTQCGNFMIFVCIIQILREINFEDFWSAKSANVTHLEALKLDFYEFLYFLKTEIYHMNKIHSLWNGKTSIFALLESTKLISRKIGVIAKSGNFLTVFNFQMCCKMNFLGFLFIASQIHGENRIRLAE